MRTKCWPPLALALVVSTAPATVSAQPACEAPASSAWLRQSSGPATNVRVDPSRVHPVIRDLPVAIGMLSIEHALALSQHDAMRFAGAGAGMPPPPDGLRPYLVRAVFPTANPQLDVRWSGSDLHVSAAGLGCAPFKDHPIVVFLERSPAAVFVMATAAL